MAKITIIGGGIAGCTTALELAKQGHEVVILERDSDILRGTSARTPGRMGLGYHYFDSQTAKFYMEHTVDFMRQYSDCFLGREEEKHLRDGRYFIVNDSLIPTQEIMANYDEISLHFEEICQADSTNKIFGSSTHLHRALHQREFEQDVDTSRISYAIETRERLLDWKKFEARLKTEIATEKNIKIKSGFKVCDAAMSEVGGFVLEAEDGAKESGDFVINCTWQNIEFINEKLGIGDAHFKREDPKQCVTSRLKLLAEVELPEGLHERPSMFFCAGPHAMFSNLGNGIGRITFAPITNFGTTTESKMPNSAEQPFERWLTQGLSAEEIEFYGKKIVEGVSQYIPQMAQAKVRNVIAGIVKSKGAVNIHDKDSPFHKRDYDGVEEDQIGWNTNAAMKLFYCLGNAKRIGEIIAKQTLAKDDIRNIVRLIMHDAVAAHSEQDRTRERIFGQFFTNYLQRNYTSEFFVENENEKIANQYQAAVRKKEELLGELKAVDVSSLLHPSEKVVSAAKRVATAKSGESSGR